MQVSALFAIRRNIHVVPFRARALVLFSTGKGNLPATASAAGDEVSLANLSDR